MIDLRKLHRAWQRLLPAALLSLLLASCGGGGGGTETPGAAPPTTLPPLSAGESAFDDPAAYSTAADASLAGATEGAAVTRHVLTAGAASLAYTARAGHLIAREPASGRAQASMFYVAYTLDAAPAATRPVTFFYNGGPGSASIWLHLGSFGPQRLATGVPSTTTAVPFALVDNAQSLLDTTDMVFVDAVGTGYSQAIAPYLNRSFWSVDSDAALFRDFIQRWLAVNAREASPKVLYGESYGGPRTAVLAVALQAAGLRLDALVLQSPALDYNSNCGIVVAVNCQGNLPTYGAIGAWHRLTRPVPSDIDAWTTALRAFSAASYEPAVDAWLRGVPPPGELPALLADRTGIGASLWRSQLNLTPAAFQNNLIGGQITGRYDGRIAAARGTALAAEGDPSSTLIASSFSSAIGPYLRDRLRYTNRSTYVLLSSAIESWNFSHAGRSLPDTVPDLAAALAQNPSLRVLAVSGYHDLATPFHVTELDLARLSSDPRVQVRNYPGGHLSYLDDATRVRQKADLVALYEGISRMAANVDDGRAMALKALKALKAPAAVTRPDSAGILPTTPQTPVQQAPIQSVHRDPWVPQAQVRAAARERESASPGASR